MESSKEHIEAQLCAYIDGLLTPAEQAEIERHLAAHPQHRALIAELRGHSELLRELPRAKSPVELNEALTNPLERSALLNPSDDEISEGALRINRWPQITAVAAVLLLAVGLGLVVMYALPTAGPSVNGPIVFNDPVGDGKKKQTDGKQADGKLANVERAKAGDRLTELAAGVDGADKFNKVVPADPLADAARRKAAASGDTLEFREKALTRGMSDRESQALGRPVGGNAGAIDALNAAPELNADRGRKMDLAPAVRADDATEALRVREELARQNGLSGKDLLDVHKRLAAAADGATAAPGGAGSYYLVVSAPDAAAAQTQVTAFLNTNGIPFQNHDAAAVTTAGASLALKDADADAKYLRHRNEPLRSTVDGTGQADAQYGTRTATPAPAPAEAGGVAKAKDDSTSALADANPVRGSRSGAAEAKQGDVLKESADRWNAPAAPGTRSPADPAPAGAIAAGGGVDSGKDAREAEALRGAKVDVPPKPSDAAITRADNKSAKRPALEPSASRLAQNNDAGGQRDLSNAAAAAAAPKNRAAGLTRGGGGAGGAAGNFGSGPTSESDVLKSAAADHLSLNPAVPPTAAPIAPATKSDEINGVALAKAAAAEPQPTVIVARMNRRQANELSAALARERGQWAELKDYDALNRTPVASVLGVERAGNSEYFAQGAQGQKKSALQDTPAMLGAGVAVRQAATQPAQTSGGKGVAVNDAGGAPLAPATPAKPQPTAGVADPASTPTPAAAAPAVVAAKPAEALRLNADPADEAIDVVIVVKGAPSPATPTLEPKSKASTDPKR